MKGMNIFMKKVIAVLLTVAMLASVLCMNVSAAETSVTKEKLQLLTEYYRGSSGIMGIPIVHYQYNYAWKAAEDVLGDENSTEADYQNALDVLKNDALNNVFVYYYYAEATYGLALKEENYNNWYSEEDWTDFQNKLAQLKVVLDENKGNKVEESFESELANAYRALMGSYNKMTNAYTLKGDLNKDGEVNVLDVTLLQKYLAGTENLTGAQKMLANAEEYENPKITEATLIQKYAAEQISEFPDYGNFFAEDERANYLDEDLVYERTLNFNICPRKASPQIYRISNEYKYQQYDIIFGYYLWCNQNGYEP